MFNNIKGIRGYQLLKGFSIRNRPVNDAHENPGNQYHVRGTNLWDEGDHRLIRYLVVRRGG
jgi:hypothetical protein